MPVIDTEEDLPRPLPGAAADKSVPIPDLESCWQPHKPS
jgi:hypothetical protein